MVNEKMDCKLLIAHLLKRPITTLNLSDLKNELG